MGKGIFTSFSNTTISLIHDVKPLTNLVLGVGLEERPFPNVAITNLVPNQYLLLGAQSVTLAIVLRIYLPIR